MLANLRQAVPPHRRPFVYAILLAAISLGPSAAPTAAAEKGAQPRLGINLAGPADWNTELPFVDVFRLSRTWISQKKGAGWGKGPELQLDEHGWVKRLEDDCYAETPLCTIEGGRYPGGHYTVLYEGQGTIDFWGAATVAAREAGRIILDVQPEKGGIFLRLVDTNPEDYVRKIRVIMPGHEETYREQPWRPGFLRLWQGVAAVRFMDLMETNNSPISRWEERPQVEDATYTRQGVPAELLIDLANRLQAAPWFCMPHQADDGYVRNFASLVRDRLDPKLPIYVEYSNEVWNGQFAQHRYAAEQGQRLGLAEKSWEAAWRYTAVRSMEIFGIWEEVLGGTERLVRVLPSQAANAHVSREVVAFRNAYQHADALAIAPYVSLNLRPQGDPPADEVASWPVERLLDHVESKSLPESLRWIEESRKVADQYGLKLLAYEAGQHLVGIQGAENNEPLTKLLHRANAHPRMGEIYRSYLDGWKRQGGDLLCHFSSVGEWSKWGSWGLLQYADQDHATSPKFMAVMQWARSLGQPVQAP